MNETVAILDACVLYPAPLRDFFMHLALLDAFRARWTEAIHDEWIRNVLKNRPDLSRAQLERTRELMNAHVRDCIVEDYENLIESLDLPDADDRHVLAAAIHAKADAIVTFNLKDFPKKKLAPYDIEAVDPDAFIIRLIDEDAALVIKAFENQHKTLKNPPRSAAELLETLENNGLAQTASRLRQFARYSEKQR